MGFPFPGYLYTITAQYILFIQTMNDQYDIGIIGGGLGGLALSIQLARMGHAVVLFEKEEYPFHRVCGEYISNESRNFLMGLGLDPAGLGISLISTLQLSDKNGKLLQQELPLGGFGISRYKLDAELAKLAKEAGVSLFENSKVNDVVFTGKEFVIDAGKERCTVRVAAGSFGKRSNLDIKWKRPFASAKRNKLNNYIGIKYHIQGDFLEKIISLHLFNNGYCGLAKVEGDRYNLCYLTTADNLQQCGGDIEKMESTILSSNPHLKQIFERGRKCDETPVTISQISFDKKQQVENHILMVGDAAGMITPLCGNGMSMALHASKLAATEVNKFLSGSISREGMEKNYRLLWEKEFAARLRMGRRIQSLFGNQRLLSALMNIGRRFPFIISYLVKKTHGKPF
jgi:flavin-dependent dehydrogenase